MAGVLAGMVDGVEMVVVEAVVVIMLCLAALFLWLM